MYLHRVVWFKMKQNDSKKTKLPIDGMDVQIMENKLQNQKRSDRKR